MVEKIESPPAMILAGGLSRRMGGGDKGLLRLDDRPILAHVIERVRPQVSALALNANGDVARFAAFDLDVVADSIPGHAGPLAGLLAGLDWSRRVAPGASHLLTVPSDTPFLPLDLAAKLRTAIQSPADSAIAATASRVHPVIGLWSLAIRDRLRDAVLSEGIRKVEAWTERIGARAVVFDAARFDPFFNINRPEDLERAGEVMRLNP